jgi:hypothetical protein
MPTLFLLRPLAEPAAPGPLIEALRQHQIGFDRLWHEGSERSAAHAACLAPLSARPPERKASLRAPLDEPLPRALAETGALRLGLVAEEPLLSQLVAWLVLGLPQIAHRSMLLPGAVVWLEGEARPAGMALVAHLTPTLLGLDGGGSDTGA